MMRRNCCSASSIPAAVQRRHTSPFCQYLSASFTTPTGYAVFAAHPIVRRTLDPAGQAEHWSEFSQAGHFPAMEEPDLLADDLRTFFRRHRS